MGQYFSLFSTVIHHNFSWHYFCQIYFFRQTVFSLVDVCYYHHANFLLSHSFSHSPFFVLRFPFPVHIWRNLFCKMARREKSENKFVKIESEQSVRKHWLSISQNQSLAARTFVFSLDVDDLLFKLAFEKTIMHCRCYDRSCQSFNAKIGWFFSLYLVQCT